MPGPHDLHYRQLFAHPELVRDLLGQFTPFSWLGELEVSAFERVNPVYASERASARENDLVWRVRHGQQTLYVYLLLELQSRSDRWMALRMQVYVGLLYQDLIKRREVKPGALLPPVLPLVFYHGSAPWHAELELGKLILAAPRGLRALQAAQRYLLVDLRRLDPELVAHSHSLLGLLFRLELSSTSAVVQEILPALSAWLAHPAQAPLVNSVQLWLGELVKREMPAIRVDEVADALGDDMGERKFATWQDYLLDQGMQKGRELGKAEGKAEGEAQVRAQVRAEWRTVLLKVLEARFGKALPGEEAQLAQVPDAQLQDWLVRAACAPDRQALFGAAGGQGST